MQTSLPLKAIETDFAVDSSGFSTCHWVRWFNKRYGKEQDNRRWLKAHVTVGTTTGIVSAAEITDWMDNDSPLLPELVKRTAETFKLRKVTADKGYSSQANLEAIAQHGAMPYVAFKSNATGAAGDLWGAAYHYFMLRRDEFLREYHSRSIVESVFSSIKRKFASFLRTKSEVAMRNELLAKIVCYNITCLINAIYELGLEPIFWADKSVASKSLPA